VTDRERTGAEPIAAELHRLAEIAAGILDGEDVKRIIHERSMRYVANPDPDHRFLAGDHYDVDAELFLRTKKLLLRIVRLGTLDVGSSVWVPVGQTGQVTVAVHNGVHRRYYTFGQLALPAPPEMQAVLDDGRIRIVLPDEQAPSLVTALAPVTDSLGDVVGVVELSAPISQTDPPAWS